ncbi:MAG TPA: histone deacetylase [Actinomycetota bacterium]|jgi:acetoin utilization deacetylase AcuC-like enzyme|nr:histone deacetylase [Actinomycetota bacterium]
MPSVGFVFHDAALRHVGGHPDHPERSERIDAIRAHLEATGLLARLDHHAPDPAGRELIELVHDPSLVTLLEEIDAAGGGRIDLDTGMGPGSLEAAMRGSRGAVDAAERVLEGVWTAAFVCMRPPGHHATATRSMGFCLTNHVAVAARWAVGSGRAERVAVIDWDAHHGNGTQDIFWTDPSVLYVSLHQFPWYPGTGDATERGAAEALGTTVNIPLPAGAAEDAYERAFDEVIDPAVHEFEPQLVFVSAGYDAHMLDPLCMMRLTAGAFYRFAGRVAGYGAGPVCLLEGGYDLDALGWSAGATVSALLGDSQPSGVPDDELNAAQGTPDALDWVRRAAILREKTTS